MANGPSDPGPRDADQYPGTPRWVKVIGIILLGVVLLVAFAIATGLGGPHGPQRHGATAPLGVETEAMANAQ